MDETDIKQSLRRIPDSFLETLREMIDRNDPCLLVKGSSPADINGCCPSAQAGYAETLVEAGLLESWAPSLPEGSCPAAFHAFRGEIRQGERDTKTFSPDSELRAVIKDTIEARLRFRKRLKLVILAMLGALIGMALWMAVRGPG